MFSTLIAAATVASSPLRGAHHLMLPRATLRTRQAQLRGGVSPAISLSDKRMQNNGDSPVEQVHVGGGNVDEMFVTWVTNITSASTVTYSVKGSNTKLTATGSSQIYNVLMLPPSYEPDEIQCTSHNYTKPECFYTSGHIHTVLLSGLQPATAYDYTVEGDTRGGFSFTTPPAVGSPITFGIIGDLGQTENSTHTVKQVKADEANIDMVLLAGDLSYADGYAPRWDSYARSQEFLWSGMPTAYVGGNHEVSNGGENWVGYQARYPNNHERAGSDTFLWYSFEAGAAHVLMLCSYADTSASSAQMEWLKKDLATVDKTKTPWLIAVWHTPWYTSNQHHPMTESAEMRASMEDVLHDAQVDVVFSGHVHAYERTFPVYKEQANCSHGIPYVTIGDGGNREQFAVPWLVDQPAWSALREYAYGHGKFTIYNHTHAQFSWLRNNDTWNPNPSRELGDEFTIVKGTGATEGSCTANVYTKP